MKRFILLTALVLVFSIVMLTVVSSAINVTEDQIEQIVQISKGDSSVLDGLMLKTGMTYDQKLLWETSKNIKTGESKVDFSYQGSKIHRDFITLDIPPYQLYTRICNSHNEADPICNALKQKDTGMGVDEIVNLHDYYKIHDLYLGECYVYTDQEYDIYGATNSTWTGSESKFNLLQIPIEEDDIAEISMYQGNGSSGEPFVDASFTRFANSYESYVLNCDGGVILSVGFAPNVKPLKTWAPYGFGLWMIPKAEKMKKTDYDALYWDDIFLCNEARLVYPLDIESQRVLALKWSGNGENLLLITAENGQAILRILDGKSYALKSQMALCPIGESENSYGYFTQEINGQEIAVTEYYFDPVAIHRDEDFTAIAVGDTLTVLDKNCKVDFACKLVSLCRSYKSGETPFFWSDDEKISPEDLEAAYQDKEFHITFAQKPMVYKNHMLAIAWYDYDNGALLQVYGPEGLIYAERSTSSLESQFTPNDRRSNHYFYLPSDMPELRWE